VARWRPLGRADLRAALPGWVAARALVAVALVLGTIGRRLPGVRLPGTVRFGRGGLLGWDADWYRRIAEHGYRGVGGAGLRFFPLLPVLARVLGVGTGVGIAVALLVLANGPALVVGGLVHRLAKAEGCDAATARLAATLVALAPPAFVLVMGYTEGLALCALLGAVLCAREGRWWWAAACALVAGLARPTGILVDAPLGLLALGGLRRAPLRSLVARGAALLAPLAGTGLFLWWVGRTFGDPLLPYRVQSNRGLRGASIDPFSRLGRAVWTVAHGGVGLDGHDLWALVAVALLVPTVRRWSPHLSAFAVLTVGVALSATRLGSFERYVWASVVPVLTVAWLCRSPRARRFAPVVSGVLMATAATLAFLGYYVP
jgi:hypothetical protein